MKVLNGWPAALLDPAHAAPADLCTWNGSDPVQRFAVYRNNVQVSLVDALASTYPVVQQLVGEPFFRAMGQLYVRLHPPTTPVLAHHGQQFADFVTQFPPAGRVPYLADVARLEWLRLQALHAADAEPLALDVAQRWLAEPQRLAQAQCRLLPCVKVLRTAHAAVSVWAAHQPDSGLQLEDIDTHQPEAALVFRSGWSAAVQPVDTSTADFATQLQAGRSLGDALQATSGRHPAWDGVQALALLFRHGLVAQLVLPEPERASPLTTR